MPLIDYLESFNRKERFFLIGQALDNRDCTPGDPFRRQIGGLFGLAVPPSAMVAMDYHLDWLHAGLLLAQGLDEDTAHPNSAGVATGQQEDVDLLIAFEVRAVHHVVLIEAKATTGWTNAQMESKAKRLGRIFGQSGDRFDGVVPHFALMSPRRPSRIECSGWPAWMAPGGSPLWTKLVMPEGRRTVGRTDRAGKPSASGSYFSIRDS